MRYSQSSPIALSLLICILSTTHLTLAKPYPRAQFSPNPLNHLLDKRQCVNPCGYNRQLCCTASQTCITDSAGEAQCVSGSSAGTAQGNGQWQLFTTTYVQTDLVTVVTTYSSFIPAATTAAVAVTTVQAPAPAVTAICNANLNQQSCGPICCAQGQFCQYSGQCAAYGGSSANAISTVFVASTAVNSPSGSASAGIRPTSNTVVTVTSTGTATTTIPFQTPVGTDGSAAAGVTATTNKGLSGGAIAGIVIGVLLGLFLLFLLLACCCAKSLIDGLLGLFGLGPNRKTRRTETTTFISDRHRTSGGATTSGGRRWFGTRPARVSTAPPPKKSSGAGGAAGVAAFLATLAVILGLKRRSNRNEDKSSYNSESIYTYSDSGYTSPSKLLFVDLLVVEANNIT